jgi:hypothetical protein
MTFNKQAPVINTGAFSFMASGRRSGRGSQHSMVLFVSAASRMRHSARDFLRALSHIFRKKPPGVVHFL